MKWNGVRKNGNGRKIISVLLIVFLLSLILPESAKADNTVKSPHNYFYTMVIKNTLAAIYPKENTKNEVGITKHPILSFLGVDFSDPISIITNQIAYLYKNEVINNVNNESNGEKDLNTVSVNPFKLEDNQVIKLSIKNDDTDLVAALDNPALKKVLSNSKRVLIYHSHTSEAYRTSEKSSYINSSLDKTKNVCAVGDVITEELEKKYGISVIHDETVHDTVNYKIAYKKSRVTLDKYLKEYGDFDLIIDLHRDGVSSSNSKVTKTKINGEDVAKFMFVMTQGNPRYTSQKKLVTSMIGISNKLFPGLLDPKEMYIYNRGIDFYSQDRSNHAVLLEIGDNNNTINQVKNTGKYLSRIIAEQLNGKK